MTLLLITQLLAVAALIFSVSALAWRWIGITRRPLKKDLSTPKGSPQKGVLYAFTMGMMPWTKETVRKNWFPYVRGVAYHGGIFVGLAALLASPWWSLLPEWLHWAVAVVTGGGVILGLLGNIMRLIEPQMRAMSTPDDHVSVLLVNLFLATVCISLLASGWVPVMYVVSAIMLIYIPLGKIRHCIYFFFSRFFYGQFVGKRDVIHHAEVSR
jgi:hypothetical protein